MSEAAPPPRLASQPRFRVAARLPLLAVWVAAAVPVVLWLVHRSDPEAAVHWAQLGTTWLWRLLLALAAVASVLALLYPPFPAWLRLAGHRAKLVMSSDRGPLLRAMGELRHFESAQKHLEVGRLALQRRELQVAAPHLQRAVELDGSVAGAHHQFGLLLFRLGQLAPAVHELLAAESLDPGHAFGDAVLFAGRALDMLGEHDKAAQLLRDHARRHGGSRRSQYWFGQALAATGDLSGAAAAWHEAAAVPKQPLTAEENWFRALARVRLWQKRGAS